MRLLIICYGTFGWAERTRCIWIKLISIFWKISFKICSWRIENLFIKNWKFLHKELKIWHCIVLWQIIFGLIQLIIFLLIMIGDKITKGEIKMLHLHDCSWTIKGYLYFIIMDSIYLRPFENEVDLLLWSVIRWVEECANFHEKCLVYRLFFSCQQSFTHHFM